MAEHQVGFIGLGRMGRGMACNLAKGGANPLVFDPVPEAIEAVTGSGCRPAGSVAEVAGASDVVFLSLPGPAQVEEVVLGGDGIVAHMRPGLVLFDLSTSSRALALKLDGALRLFSTPRHVGPIGAGTVTKLAHNMLGYTIMEAQAEAFSLAVKAGLDPLDFWEALRLGMVGRQSPLMMLVAQFLPADYDNPAFAQRLALKDVRLASEMAEELGVPTRLSALAREDMEAAVERGQGDEDSRSFLKLQLERAGVEIRVPRERIAAAVARG